MKTDACNISTVEQYYVSTNMLLLLLSPARSNSTVEQYFHSDNSSRYQNYYYLNNFDNIFMAGVTLFELTVVNNWFIIMEGEWGVGRSCIMEGEWEVGKSCIMEGEWGVGKSCIIEGEWGVSGGLGRVVLFICKLSGHFYITPSSVNP